MQPDTNQTARQAAPNANGQGPAAGVMLQFDPALLTPLIRQIVEETVRAMDAERAQLGDGRLCYWEPEAAGLMGMQPWQLADERRKGRIQASVGPGRKVMYTRRQLLDYLESRRWRKSDGAADTNGRG